MKSLLLVGVGGFIGSIARYLVSKLNVSLSLFSIPVGTLLVNICGSFLIGMFAALATRGIISAETRLLLVVGLCGGFTTFSTFSNENLTLIQTGHAGVAIVYACISVALGLLAVVLGYKLSNIF